MPNPRLAARYAKSLIGLAIERNQLDQVYSDMQYLNQVCSTSREFVTLLKSPVVRTDKKLAIMSAVTQGKVGETTQAFKRLLVHKGRESYLPEIITAFIDQYKEHKGIFTVKLTTAVPVSEDIRNAIIRKAQEFAPSRQIELKTEVRENIIGGFLLELGNTLVDASVVYDLNKIRSQFMRNDFVYKIR
jgi:F-type H+-transporting ATPase subunit delta